MSENDFSRKVKELRAMHGMTLEQVASQVGVGKSTVRKWENGMIENIRRDKIASLASALHTTPAYLMGWDDISEKEAEARYHAKILKDSDLMSMIKDYYLLSESEQQNVRSIVHALAAQKIL